MDTKMAKKTPPIKSGEIVWILQDMKPRGLWPIGRITGNKPTDDDQTRIYTVKVRDKIVSIPAIRLAIVSPDYCNQPTNEDSQKGEPHPKSALRPQP